MSEPALTSPVFIPAFRDIAAITPINNMSTTITTTFAHGYLPGLIVRLFIPNGYGMQANGLVGTIISVPTNTTFVIDIDTTPYNAFVIPDPQLQFAQVIPFGEINSQLNQATMNALPPLNPPLPPIGV